MPALAREEAQRLQIEKVRMDLFDACASLAAQRTRGIELRAAAVEYRLALRAARRTDQLTGAAEQRRPRATSGEALRPSEQRVLDGLAWLERLGLYPASEVSLACVAGYRVRTAGWVALRRKLRRVGLMVEVHPGSQFELTEAGHGRASVLEHVSTADHLHAALSARLDVCELRILRVLLSAHPDGLNPPALARRCSCSRDDDPFRAARGRLLQIGLIVASGSGDMRASDVLLRYGAPDAASADSVGLRLLQGGLSLA